MFWWFCCVGWMVLVVLLCFGDVVCSVVLVFSVVVFVGCVVLVGFVSLLFLLFSLLVNSFNVFSYPVEDCFVALVKIGVSEVDFMKDCITAAENIAIKIYEQLEEGIKSTGNHLYSVKLYETENNYVEYYG